MIIGDPFRGRRRPFVRPSFLHETSSTAAPPGRTGSGALPAAAQEPPTNFAGPFETTARIADLCMATDKGIARFEDMVARAPANAPGNAETVILTNYARRAQGALDGLPQGPERARTAAFARDEGMRLLARVSGARRRGEERFRRSTLDRFKQSFEVEAVANPSAAVDGDRLYTELVRTAGFDPEEAERELGSGLNAFEAAALSGEAQRTPGGLPVVPASADRGPAVAEDETNGGVEVPSRPEQVNRAGKTGRLPFSEKLNAVMRETKDLRKRTPDDGVDLLSEVIDRAESILHEERGDDGKTIAQFLAALEQIRDHAIRESMRFVHGDQGAQDFDELTDDIDLMMSSLRTRFHETIEQIGAARGLNEQRIAQYRNAADAGIAVAMAVLPGTGRRRGGGDSDDGDHTDRGPDDRSSDQLDDHRPDPDGDRQRDRTSEELREPSPNDAGSFAEGEFVSETDYLRFREIIHSGVPLGFRDRAHFEEVAERLSDALGGGDGFDKAQWVIRGSSVTGRKYNRETRRYEDGHFDEGRVSDWDLAVVDESLLGRIQADPVLRKRFMAGNGFRTKALRPSDLRRFNLFDIADELEQLSQESGRKMTIMIYREARRIQERGPAMWLP